MYKIFILFLLFTGCGSVNNPHAMQKYSEKIKYMKKDSYLSMSKARYEEIYHGMSPTKYHLKKNPRRNSHTMVKELQDLALVWPASGILTSSFGVRTLHHRTKMHMGIDIAAQVGTPVYASETGRIVFSGVKKGYGKVIMVRHDKIHETLYGHLSHAIVKPNQIVHRNQLIGFVGKTGHVTGANLHFETRVNGVAKDPLKFLPGSYTGKQRVYVGGESIAVRYEYPTGKKGEG